MNIKIFSALVFASLYLCLELAQFVRQRHNRYFIRVRNRTANFIFVFCLATACWLSLRISLTDTGHIYHQGFIPPLSLLLIISGLLVRINSVTVLNHSLEFTIEKLSGYLPVEDGLYRWIRHPAYLGQLMVMTGISLFLANWLSLIVLIVLTLTGYSIRIRTEEKILLEQMGQAYRDYQVRTKKIIPWVY